MPPTTNRDEAVQILTAFLSKLFTRAWMPWTPRHAAAIARLIDCIIAAAADQVRAKQEDAFLDDLLVEVERPTQATTRRFRREGDDLYAEDDPTYQAWRQRSQQEDVRGILKREGR